VSPTPTLVYAIATGKLQRLSEGLILFSAINLANQARAIERLGFKVALAKVELK
jgi:uncharacterized protein (TIGR04141 family)